MEEALGIRPIEAYIDRDLLLVLPDAASVRNLKPNLNKIKNLIIKSETGIYLMRLKEN